MQQAGW